MSLNSTALPENIRRRMAPETRKAIGKAAMTQSEAEAKFTARREKEIQENIAGLLRQRNITFFRQTFGRKATGTKGQPDFIFAVKGQACACEVKSEHGRLTKEQTDILWQLNAQGWAVATVTSEALFLAWLNVVTREAANA